MSFLGKLFGGKVASAEREFRKIASFISHNAQIEIEKMRATPPDRGEENKQKAIDEYAQASIAGIIVAGAQTANKFGLTAQQEDEMVTRWHEGK